VVLTPFPEFHVNSNYSQKIIAGRCDTKAIWPMTIGA
jgi:hypothetical protein